MKFLPKKPEPIDAIQVPSVFDDETKKFLRESSYAVCYKNGCMSSIELDYQNAYDDICVASVGDYIIFDGYYQNLPMYRVMAKNIFENRYVIQ